MARAGKETGCLDMRTGDRYFVVVRPSLPRVLAMFLGVNVLMVFVIPSTGTLPLCVARRTTRSSVAYRFDVLPQCDMLDPVCKAL